jgi:hypothetical protein
MFLGFAECCGISVMLASADYDWFAECRGMLRNVSSTFFISHARRMKGDDINENHDKQ